MRLFTVILTKEQIKEYSGEWEGYIDGINRRYLTEEEAQKLYSDFLEENNMTEEDIDFYEWRRKESFIISYIELRTHSWDYHKLEDGSQIIAYI